MLKWINSPGKLSYGNLTEVYADSLRKDARRNYPNISPYEALHFAEQDFYRYMTDVFFKTRGASCAVWEVRGKYISVLRWEPYKSGFLITGLETAPDYRGKGYATMLLGAVLRELRGDIFSHIDKNNISSIAVHEKCGFGKLMDCACYLDGSVSSQAGTWYIHMG